MSLKTTLIQRNFYLNISFEFALISFNFQQKMNDLHILLNISQKSKQDDSMQSKDHPQFVHQILSPTTFEILIVEIIQTQLITINFNMQVQVVTHPQIQRALEGYNPSPSVYKNLDQFLRTCLGNINSVREVLTQLEAIPRRFINFNAFCKIIRLLRRTVIPLKDEQLKQRLAKYLSTFAELYFPISNAFSNNQRFDEYLRLFSGLTVSQPESFNDQRQIIIYLSQNNYSEEWSANLVQKINSQVLVDKKNKQARFLKANRYYSSFIIKHFDKLLPQLERLLVRSESNIEVWEEFISSVEDWRGIDQFLVPLLTKIKHLFVSNGEIAIKIVVPLTKSLTEEKSIKDFVTFISGLISSEPNIKKKTIYIRMLKGIIETLKNHPDEKLRNTYAQDILVVLTNSLVKFTEEDEFNILIQILDVICPLVSDPKDDIAKAGKIYLKNQNKYIFILFATIVSNIYRKEHVDKLPSVKEVFTHFKSQLNNILKTNWQCTLPVLNFMADCDLEFVDNLGENMPLFKVSCLTLSKIEKKIAFRLILKYLQFLRQSEDEEISNNIYVIIALLLQEIKDRTIWQLFVNSISIEERIKIVSRGIYPLTLFPCHELKINKGNSFTSLLLYIYQSFKKQNITVPHGLDFIKNIIVYSNLRPLLKNQLQTEEKGLISSTIEKYVSSSLFDHENDEENTISNQQRSHIELLSNEILTYDQQYLIQLLQQFTNEEYYKNNLQFLQGFEKKILESLKSVKDELNEIKNELIQRSIYKSEEEKPKKIYIGVTLEVKMMSEQEVKQQKYHKHFLKMLAVFDKIISKLLRTLNSHQLISKLWQHNLKSILAVTKFPEHRLSVQKLVKRSCLYTAWYNRQSQESRLFSKYSQFLGEFFAFRHSKFTPSLKIMNHCEEFLKELLALPFEQNNYNMLQSNDNQFVMLFVNEMCEYLLENMEFDVNLKRYSIQFYHKCIIKNINFHNHGLLFTYIANNINILANSENIQTVLLYLLKNVDKSRIKELFSDILNYIQSTKKLILHTLLKFEFKYKPEFEEYIKLRILALESNQEISRLSNEILTEEKQVKDSILTFNMKNFVKKNSKETIEKLCIFIKEEITPETCEDVFRMVIKASQELFDEGFDQQGLEMFPFFLTINIDYINENLYKPIFELLILKFTAKENFGTLTKLSVEVGISIIKKNAHEHAEKLLLVLETFINKATGVSNIIYLGVLAPYLQGNKNLQIIQKRITELFKSNKEAEQRSISKCMPDLMSFFKQPLEIIEYIYNNISTMPSQEMQIGQSYLFSGLLKGIGYKLTQTYLDKILASTYVTKTKMQKTGRIHLVNSLVENFGRVVELKGVKIISIMIGYMADNAEQIRNLSKRVGQSLIIKMSSYSVKILLPELLKGLEQEQNWRVKISYIWILGIMANCSAKQLQTSLPIIVPTLSTCLSNAHPIIREKASQALSLIGQTIKNPEISQSVDILIEALENPFENSEKALEVLLKTSFSHFIDPPSLSMIIPILDYCMRGRSSDLKAGSCQVIGSIVELIGNPYDLLPYLKIVITGLKVALCDPLPEIRCIAAMSIGRISAKIGIKEAEIYFNFVIEIIESPLSNTTERQGAAQAYAEIICSQTYEYFEESLYKIFEKLNSIKHSEKQGYILVFLYVPSIRTQQFEGFIKEVNENMYQFVSDEEENIRNSAMLVEKVLINNYCLSHTDLLLGPLCDGVFEHNWKKRNSALILIGEMLNIIKSHMYNTRTTDKNYAYYRGLMAVYIIKDDDLEMPRMTANQVWNAYIENTPKTIKLGLNELSKMWTRWTHAANGVVFKNIVAFSGKYGENYFPEILEHLQALLSEPEHQVGVFQVLSEFIKRLGLLYLSKENFKQTIRSIFTEHLYTIPESVRPSLARSLALYIDKMHEEAFFEELLYSTIQKMDSTLETNIQYTKNLHLLKDLLNTNSHNVVDRVINKIMQAPMSQFKIEVITNNAERLANYLYSHFKVPATEVFIEEIYILVQNKEKENRLSLIIYCLEQVSLQLNQKNKALFVKMINVNINKGISIYSEDKTNACKRKTLEIFINMLLFFLNSSQLSEMEELESTIGQLSPLVFFEDELLKSLGHKIFLLLISDNKSAKTTYYIRQMVVSMQNNITSENQVLWSDEVTFKDYVNMLVKGIAYGKQDIMEESLDMLEFVMQHTPRSLIEKEILRIVGPIIRISNYPLLQKQKIRIMEILINILKQSFKIDAYNNQILSVCLRLLQEFKNSEEVMRVVGDIYFALLTGTSLKQDLILTILGKLKTFGANLVHSFYYLIKSIVTEKIQLPKSLLEKVYQQCMIILLTNEGKLPVKGLYYASKIAARLSVHLGRSIEKAEANLKGLVCSYENVIQYLHIAYYLKISITRRDTIEVFMKESNRDKVHYLLKSLKLCIKNSEQARKAFSLEYVREMVAENITGFDDISELIDYFQTERTEEIMEPQINES